MTRQNLYDRTPPNNVEAEQAVLGTIMVAHHIPVEIAARVEETDFYRPAHRTVWRAIQALADKGNPIDPITVAAELARTDQLADLGGGPFVHTLIAEVMTTANGGYYANIVRETAELRRLSDVGTRIVQLAYETPQDIGRARAEAQRLMERLGGGGATSSAVALELDAFLNEPGPEFDWLVTDLLERRDRVGLTGPEGGGKSTLLRQIGVQVSAGVHPFTLEKIDPVRVLLVDLENSRRFVRRELRKLRLAAGEAYSGDRRLYVATRPQGLDLYGQPDDATWLEQEVRAAQPELLIVGPVYKMASGDPIKEEVARAVQQVIDRLRATYDVAVLLEMHTGHAQGGGRRPIRPVNNSAWLRWPEFGLYLADTGGISHWRGPRDQRAWPASLKRGGAWPWTLETSRETVAWSRIQEVADASRDRPSVRDLEVALGMPKSTVQRVLKSHESEWHNLCATLWGTDE